MLRAHYGNIGEFNAAWGCHLTSFEEAGSSPLEVKTKAAKNDMSTFFSLFLDARYKLVGETFRKHDSNHLLIGDRWTPATASLEEVVKKGARYFDLISINYYSYGIDKGFLDRAHRWAGKPILLSEFFFAAVDQGLHGGNTVKNQTERGLAYRNYLEQAASTGYVVGVQWFLGMIKRARDGSSRATTARQPTRASSMWQIVPTKNSLLKS